MSMAMMKRRQYDRYAGFIMDEKLNQAAAHRLEAALANGYSGDAIPGEGTLKDYLAQDFLSEEFQLPGTLPAAAGRTRMTPSISSSARLRINMIPTENEKIPGLLSAHWYGPRGERRRTVFYGNPDAVESEKNFCLQIMRRYEIKRERGAEISYGRQKIPERQIKSASAP